MTKCEPHKRNHSKGNGQHPEVNRCYGSYVETPTIISDEKFPTSIIREPKQHIKGKSYHPTEKPVGLLRYLIRTYTNENDVVLDNTMGSGSTIIASIRENRQYIGIEKEEKYFDIANKRIAAETSQLSLF
jgi:DNA modification methylase